MSDQTRSALPAPPAATSVASPANLGAAPADARPAPRPPPPPLPNARHLARVLAHLNAEALHRVRSAAYQLPQVVAAGDLPSDQVPEHAAEADERMDELGRVLLQ